MNLFLFARAKSCVDVVFSCFTDAKLQEFTVDEKEVSKILLQVAVARREAEIVSTLSLTAFASCLSKSECKGIKLDPNFYFILIFFLILISSSFLNR